MGSISQDCGPIRFGVFEADLAAHTLRKNGARVRLQEKPFRVLAMLLARPGEVVTRDELKQALWPDEEYGEFDLGLNTAVKKVRKALGDSGSHPRWIETLPKVGYRFLAEPQAPPVPPPSSRRSAIAIGLAALAAVAAYVLWPRSSPALLNPSELVETVLTRQQGREVLPSFSPDGSRIAYSAQREAGGPWRIYVEVVGSGQPLPITDGKASDYGPAWSPDGRSIAFLRKTSPMSDAELIVIPALGGHERTLLTFDGSDLRGGSVSWSPDGMKIAYPARPAKAAPFRIALLDVASRETRWLTSPDPGVVGDASPAFAPDGSQIAFVRRGGYGSGWNVLVVPLTSDLEPAGPPSRITDFDRMATGPAWTPDGTRILFVGEQASGQEGVWSVSPDGGKPELLWRLPGILLSELAHSALTVAPAPGGGLQIAYSFEGLRDVDVYRVDLAGPRRGEPTPLIATSARDTNARHSPDGKKIAYLSGRPMRDIWICDLDGGNPRRLTDMGSRIGGPLHWSPDSRLVAFHSRPAGAADFYVVDTESGVLRQLTDDPYDDALPVFSRDAESIYFLSKREGEWATWKMPASGGPAQRIVGSRTATYEEDAAGDWLYFASRDSGDFSRLSLRDPGAPPELLLPNASDALIAFRLAGSGLYFLASQASTGGNGNDGDESGLLCRYDLATREVTELFPVAGYLSSVAPDESHILTVHGPPPSVDLRMLAPAANTP